MQFINHLSQKYNLPTFRIEPDIYEKSGRDYPEMQYYGKSELAVQYGHMIGPKGFRAF